MARAWQIGVGTTPAPFNAAPGGDADVTAWAAAVVANGGTVSAGRQTVLDTFVAAEKAAGTWAMTDDYWGLWGENAPQALTSLKQRRLAVATAAPAFVADQGYTSNGTSSYIATGFNLSTHLVAATLSNLRAAVYARTNIGASLSALGAASSTSIGIRLRARLASDRTQTQIASTNSTGTIAVTDSRGLTSASRNGSAGAVLGVYKNGVLLESYTPATFGASLPSLGLYLLAANAAGVAAEFYTGQVGFAAIGAALTAPQEAAQYANVQAWATAIGAAA